jgi:PAS domain S-box-containing protein
MVRKMRWLAVICFLLTLVCGQVAAQSYLVHHYTEHDGLPSTEVREIRQDGKGRMWFATRAGVAVYDGVKWRTFTVRDGLPGMSIYKMDIDGKDRVWAMPDISRGNALVSYFQEGGWLRIPRLVLPAKAVVDITAFRVMDLNDRDFPCIAVGTEAHGLYFWNGKKWRSITEKNGLAGNTVHGIAALKEKFYIATHKGLTVLQRDGTGKFAADNRLTRELPLPTKEIRGIGIEYSGKYPAPPMKYSRIWLIGPSWLGYFAENTEKLTFFPLDVKLKSPKKQLLIQPDHRSGIYFGSIYRVYYFNYKTRAMHHIGVNNGLVSEGAYSMIIDFEKNTWISCHRGVSKIVSRRFGNLRFRHGLLEDEVSAIIRYEPGKYLLGHNFGVTFYEPAAPGRTDRFQRVPFFGPGTPRMPLSRVLDMQHDSRGNTWAAAGRAGLAKIDPQRKVTWYHKTHGLPDYVVCLWISETDVLWVGTEKGIFLRTGEKFERRAMGEFTAPHVRRIYGKAGKLRYLAGTASGLYIYNEKANTWKNYRFPGGDIRANAVYAIKEWRNGRLLIGTGGGLYVLEDGGPSIEKVHVDGFKIDRPVYSILEDAKMRLWFGTDNGVVRWDSMRYKWFSIADGLVGQEINRAAALMDDNGRLWFGTNNGLSIYDEEFDNGNYFRPVPRLRLLHAEVAGKNLPLNQAHRLDYRQNTIVFHFRGISFMDERETRFKSRLEGFNEGWSQENYPYKQMIRYTNLSPGSYRFHLKARNSEGAWSPVVSSAEIEILKPYYERWWFYSGLFLLLLFIVYSVSRFFTQKRYAALLEKKVEERSARLHVAERRYRHLFEESADTVFITTAEGTFVDVNPAGVKLFGYGSKEQLLGLKSTKMLYDDLKERKKYFAAIEEKGHVKNYELAFRKKNGDKIITHVTASVVRDSSGKVAGYRGIIRDITRQKRLERQLMQAQKMEAIGTLAGGIAHDFNNILGVIVGYTELALDDLDESSQIHANIKQVMTAAERASGLVKQILAFSRQSERKRKPLKLNVIVKEALKLLRSTLPATIDIRQDIEPDSGLVLADATQMHQVLMNLCTNSAHAMQDMGGTLEVELKAVDIDEGEAARYEGINPGKYLRLTVKDTGHGIPRVVLKRIFEPYFTTKKAGEGTGMGMAVVHGIIKSHGGDINVLSEPGKGTAIHVLLPRIIGVAPPKTDTAELSVRGTERLLMVDDEKSLIQAGVQMMSRLGYQVTGATDPLKALDMFKQDPDGFDLVVTDLTMPHLTGLQLAREIKNIKPGIPIILSSGFSTLSTRQKIKAYGIDDFVMKPIVRNELALVVRKALGKKGKN